MLKRLRLKFIIVYMVLVMVMMNVIFIVLYYSTARSLENESIQMLGSIAINPIQGTQPQIDQIDQIDEESTNIHLPYFSVLIDSSGNTTVSGGDFGNLTQEDQLNKLLDLIESTDDQVGVLQDYKLRFFQTDTPMGKCVVFADITSELSTLHNLLKTFVIIGILSFLASLGISVLLSIWATRPVEQAWIKQKQFVADASHELKTPLTVIMSDTELLLSEDFSAEERKHLSQSILTMTQEMRGLVESLLELARIDNGSIQKHLTEVSFSELLQETALIFEPLFFEKDKTFSYEIEPDIVLNGNSTQLRQLADILLDNAVKYASPGGITSMTLSSLPGDKCLLCVSSQGVPISNSDLKKIFQRFYRIDPSRTGRHSYGLGLSIAEQIASEHHGKIWAESQTGYNSFYFSVKKKTGDRT